MINMNILHELTRNIINIPGWRTKRKIVVIESDDWGSIRMPSRQIYDKMLAEGIRVDRNPYCQYDGLATSQDLEALFDVLISVRDKNGRHAVITADAVVANPDFEKIEASGFERYFYEPFTMTLSRSSNHQKSFELWKQGMECGIFHPQFHGREHLNVCKWMNALREDNEMIHRSFGYKTFGLTSQVDSRISNYMGAFNSVLPSDIDNYRLVIKEGLDLFEQIFGYRSLSFIATTYTWPLEIEPVLKQCDIKYLQGMIHQRIPLDNDSTFRYKKNNFLGCKSAANLVYLMRNCYFEPSQNPSYDWVSDCLHRINIAFRWNKPATISTHRLNFIGSIEPENTKRTLPLFKTLLHRILKKWPDVEFMTSDELGGFINRDYEQSHKIDNQ